MPATFQTRRKYLDTGMPYIGGDKDRCCTFFQDLGLSEKLKLMRLDEKVNDVVRYHEQGIQICNGL